MFFGRPMSTSTLLMMTGKAAVRWPLRHWRRPCQDAAVQHRPSVYCGGGDGSTYCLQRPLKCGREWSPQPVASPVHAVPAWSALLTCGSGRNVKSARGLNAMVYAARGDLYGVEREQHRRMRRAVQLNQFRAATTTAAR